MKCYFKNIRFVLGCAILIVPNLVVSHVKRKCPPQSGYPKTYEQGYEVSLYEMLAAYNTPDRIELKRSWNTFIEGAFTWWNGSEEGLELALSDPNGIDLSTNKGHIINLDFKYKPGFKVALGIRSQWDLSIKYTWLHFIDRVFSSAPNPTPPGSLYPLQTHPENVQNIPVDRAREKWKVDLDMIDLEIAKPYYVGTELSFRTFVGYKALFLDQNLDANYRNESTTETFRTRKKGTSWGLGPRVGVDTHWIVVGDLYFLGNLANSLLYTRYHVNQEEQTATNPSQIAIQLKDTIRELRPISEFQLGIGYGTYSFYRGFHFDICATYDFHVYWNQNVFRYFTSNLSEGTSFVRNNDLFLHGLTLNIKLDF